jgi:hypothetical protein
MASGTRCFTCRSPVDAATTTRYGRVRRPRAVHDDDVPDHFLVCGTCRPEVTDLTRHWDQRRPAATTCSFCASDADELGGFDLESVGLDGRITSQGTYLLCPSCVDVFETFLFDVREDAVPPDPPDPWRVTVDADTDVYERDSSLLRVVVTWDDGFDVRVEGGPDAPTTSIADADTYAAASAHATEFLHAVEEADGDDPVDAAATVLGEALDA